MRTLSPTAGLLFPPPLTPSSTNLQNNFYKFLDQLIPTRYACFVPDSRKKSQNEFCQSQDSGSPEYTTRLKGKRFTESDIKQLATLYAAGNSCQAVARLVNSSPARVHKLLKRNGYTLRSKQVVNNLSGMVFGSLTVLELAGTRDGFTFWKCKCLCETVVVVRGMTLSNGESTSCGCYNRAVSTSHGMSYTNEYSMYARAKYRAKQYGREFSIKPWDVIIPSHCPILGIPLQLGNREQHDNSPSIDRVDSSRGYTKDNIQVISTRANKIKGNSTVEELQLVINYMKQKDFSMTNKKENY